MSGSMRGMWKRGYGRATKAPPDERGGNRHARPTATAPHPNSTHCLVQTHLRPAKPRSASHHAAPNRARRIAVDTSRDAATVSRARSYEAAIVILHRVKRSLHLKDWAEAIRSAIFAPLPSALSANRPAQAATRHAVAPCRRRHRSGG